MALKTTRWDSADYLKTKEDIAGYLDAVLEDGDPELLKLALGNVARSKGMTEIAKDARLSRSSLYKALSPDGNPAFAVGCRSCEKTPASLRQIAKEGLTLPAHRIVAAVTPRPPAARSAYARR